MLSGKVTNTNGSPVKAVTMALSGASMQSTTTAADGTYSFGVTAGTYTVTPQAPTQGSSFNPPSRTVSVQSSTGGVDFILESCPTGTLPASKRTMKGDTAPGGENARARFT